MKLKEAQDTASNIPKASTDFVPKQYAHTGYAVAQHPTRYIYPYGFSIGAVSNE